MGQVYTNTLERAIFYSINLVVSLTMRFVEFIYTILVWEYK